MCDYSLGGLPNRLAVEGEELTVHRFPTYSIGLASLADLQSNTAASSVPDRTTWQRIRAFLAAESESTPVPAVCVPPGARLILTNIPLDLQRKWKIGQEENVVFVQTGVEGNVYRDAICFRNGYRVLLQELSEGIPVQVISLGGDLIREPEPAFAVSSARRPG
jgi:hypothetical protein